MLPERVAGEAVRCGLDRPHNTVGVLAAELHVVREELVTLTHDLLQASWTVLPLACPAGGW